MKTALFIKGQENPILVKESINTLFRRIVEIGSFMWVTDQAGRFIISKDMVSMISKIEGRLVENKEKKAKKAKK